ncbi:hypothetical protein R6Q57_003541, partial [Mikania cordata]
MADPQIPPTTDQSTSSFIPTSTQPSPNTIYSPTYEVTPNNTTHPTPTSLEPNHTFSPSTTIPPLSYFFPNFGQSSSTMVHASSSIRPPTQVGSGPIGDGYGDRYEEEFKGYEEEGYYYGSDVGYMGHQAGLSQPLQQSQEMGRLPVGVQHIRPKGQQLQ